MEQHYPTTNFRIKPRRRRTKQQIHEDILRVSYELLDRYGLERPCLLIKKVPKVANKLVDY